MWVLNYMIDGSFIQILLRNDLLDDLLLDFLAQLLSADILRVLSTDNNSMNSNGDDSTVVVLILNRNLGLGIWSEPWDAAISAGGRHASVELVCQLKGQREELWGLIGSIAEHDTLISSTKLFESLLVMETLGDVRRLFLDCDKDVAGLVIEAFCGVIVSNVFDSCSDNSLVVESRLGRDFAKDHNHASLGGGFARNFGERVLSQAGVENGIGDLISDLVRMALAD